MQALILAGGHGKRLKPYTDEKPKPMLEVAGRPIIGWQLDWLKRSGISNIVISAGYHKEKIIDYIGSGSKFGVRVGYSIEEIELGTGGGIKNCSHFFKEDFFVLYGDILTTIDLWKLKGNIHAISTVPFKSPFGIVTADPDSHAVVGFVEKPILDEIWINAGVYHFTNQIFDYLPDAGDFENMVLPELAKKGMLRAVKFENSYWRSIDSHKDLEEASKEVSEFLKPQMIGATSPFEKS